LNYGKRSKDSGSKPSHTNRILKIGGITMVSAGLLLAGCRDNDADSSNFQD
jgi:hypothetical protein